MYRIRGMLLVAGACLLGLTITPALADAQAQDYDWFGSRLKVRGHHLFTNYDTVRGGEDGEGGKVGYGGGLEIVLPSGLSFGVVGYTNGRVSEWDKEINTVSLAAEFNYFLKLRTLRLAPFVGIHGGLVRFEEGEFQDFGWHDGFSDLGYQYGVRFQPFTLVGVDVQMRHLSTFMGSDALGEQHTDRHFLIGLTLF